MNKLNQYLKLFALLFAITFTAFISACSDDDPPLPDNLVTFESSTVGMDDDEEIVINVVLTRAVDVATNVEIQMSGEGVTYGEHFATSPAATSNTLSVNIPSGRNTGSFTLIRDADTFLEGNEKITFMISDVGEPVLVGTSSQLILSFSAIVSEGSQVTLNGLIGGEPGSSAGNSVFVDFSNNQQTAIARTAWDLGFYNGEDFRIIINNTAGASVIEVDNNDITTVDADDINTDNLALGFGAGTFEIIDDPSGDLTNTAIPAISATADENKVYVINTVGGSGAIGATEDLVKVRILQSGDGYTLQYAKINETTFTEVEIEKNTSYNFQYFSFATGTVDVEPVKNKWDLQWTWSIFQTENPPGSGSYLPYGFSDLVFTNHLAGTEVAEVLTSTIAYDDFAESDLSTLTFSAEKNAIGSSWRVTSPTTSAGVKTDRFYVVKDSSGNIYKLKFVSFHPNDGGTRGNPVLEYALVKKAS